MRSKFDFYEIVKVKTTNSKKRVFNGKNGYVAAKSEPDLKINKNGRFKYIIEFPNIIDSPMFEEDELESTGEFFDKTKIPNYGSIRVVVDENGAGSVKASYQSYDEIKQAIEMSQAPKASGYMIEAGMVSEDLDAVYPLIELAIKHPDYIIRGAGYSALWHLLLRFKQKMDVSFLIKIMQQGLTEQNENVLETVNCIMEDLEFFLPDVWEQLNKS